MTSVLECGAWVMCMFVCVGYYLCYGWPRFWWFPSKLRSFLCSCINNYSKQIKINILHMLQRWPPIIEISLLTLITVSQVNNPSYLFSFSAVALHIVIHSLLLSCFGCKALPNHHRPLNNAANFIYMYIHMICWGHWVYVIRSVLICACLKSLCHQPL